MSDKHITRTVRYRADEVPTAGRTDWTRLRAMTEEEINAAALADDDNPPLTDEELAHGEIVTPADRRTKVPISIRMDEAALETFKRKGPRYQTRLNDLMVADAENRVLILDDGVAAAYGGIKNRCAVMNAILRGRAPSAGAAPQWTARPVMEKVQRVTPGSKGGWITEGDTVRIAVGTTRTGRHAS